MKSRLFIICCSLTVFLISCGKKPRSVLSKEKMIAVLTDIEMATSISEEQYILPPEYKNDDEYKQRIMDGVYKKHKVTKAKVDSSLVWYSQNLDEYNEINDSVIAHFRSLSTALRQDQAAIDGYRSINKQTIPVQSYLSYTHPLIAFRFTKYDLDNIDKSLLNIYFGILGMSTTDSIEAGFYFKYKDSTVMRNFCIFHDSTFHIEKPALADSLLNDFSGYIRLRQSIDSIKPILIHDFHYIDSSMYKNPATDSLKLEKPVEAS